MPKPDTDKQKLENEGMFDFLGEDAANSPARPMHKAASESAMPILRKPVPVSVSGPIKLEQSSPSDDFSFLHEGSAPASGPAAVNEFSEDWNDGVDYARADRAHGIGARWIVAGFAGFLLLAAATVYVFSRFGTGQDAQVSVANNVSAAGNNDTPVLVKPQTSSLSQQFNDQLEQLNILVTQSELDKAESLLQNMDKTVYGYGAPEFSAIEIEIAQMRSDRGIATEPSQEALQLQAEADRQAAAQRQAEFETQAAAQRQAELETQAAAQRQVELEKQAAAQRQAELETQAAAQRQAELEKQAVAQRQAELETQAAAQRQAELEKQAAAQRQAELEQQATEKRAAEIEAKAAALQAQEAERIAAAIEAERRKEAAATAAAVKAANDARIAQQRESKALDDARALAQKRARERQLALVEERRKQAAAQKAAEAAARREQKANEAKENLQITPAVAQQAPVTDEDLQLVYSKFLTLRDAVSAKDINAVIALTSQSGQRVQQLLQLFENSERIESRISNVATRNAEATIVGRLKILKIVRRDGSSVEPPASLSNIALTSKRGPGGWSVISW